MKMITSKSPLKDIQSFLEGSGIAVDALEVDNGLRTLTFTSLTGKVINLQKAGQYSESLSILVPEPPKIVQKWFVRGTAFDLPIVRSFEYQHEAEALKRKFENRADNSGESDQVILSVTQEDVEVLSD